MVTEDGHEDDGAAAMDEAPDPRKVARLLESFLEEYLSNLDVQDALESVAEVRDSDAMGKFFERVCSTYIDTSAPKRPVLRKLLRAVLKSDKVSQERTKDVLSNLVNNISDLAVDIPFASDYVGELTGLVAAFVDTGLALELLQLEAAQELSPSAQHKMICSSLKTAHEHSPSDAVTVFEALKERLPAGDALEALLRDFKLTELLGGSEDAEGDKAGEGADGAAEGEAEGEAEAEAVEVVEMIKIVASPEGRTALIAEMTQLLTGPEGAERLSTWTERVTEEDMSTAFFVQCLAASIFSVAGQSPVFLDTLKSLSVVLGDVVRKRKDLQIGVLLELQNFALQEGAKHIDMLEKACRIISEARVAQPSVFVQWRNNSNFGSLARYVKEFIKEMEKYKDDD